ncbi:ClbS/DfsB family four-helix bundle protein [Kriegella sp. EG-1]|nr:ClbS/DfsB family four-helix bundle protein [Flavobacteriaceae bacterium EG-1]
MPRPKTKEELIKLSNENYGKLMNYVEGLPKEKLTTKFPNHYLNRNIRDVLAHLRHWHLMFLKWHNAGMNGDKPEMPAPGYTWRTVPELNIIINKKYSKKTLNEIKILLESTFRQVQQIITNHNNNELFEKQKYKWTGTTSMGSYIVSATSSHYEWALKLIKKCI